MTARQIERLAADMVGFVRAFGLHRPAETPCALPIPLGEAHALMDLAEHGPSVMASSRLDSNCKKALSAASLGSCKREIG